ncbi:MAG: LuxR C-terminal-related transcriptional regulator [Prevotella sp.]|jgi:DNA-binding CsgD family transcriptional regulator|nr:LuxR C-terminal-related transcriptional regulator [Prevotella sp.]
MTKTSDFFIASNSVETIGNEQYRSIDPLICAVKAFAHMSYQSIYVIDYYKQNFLYVSENPLFLCGLAAKKVQDMGYAFYLKNVPEEELKMLVEINSSGFKFFNSIPNTRKSRSFITYDFHLINGNKKVLINHKLSPVMLTKNGRIWIALCIVSLSSHKSAGHIEFHITGSSTYWIYSEKSHQWKNNKGAILKEEEKEVLLLSSEGLTMDEIAERMCRSDDTIKFYKRNLFKKLKVKNITEALAYAVTYKLL